MSLRVNSAHLWTLLTLFHRGRRLLCWCVNGSVVPLTHTLQMGDRIEIFD